MLLRTDLRFFCKKKKILFALLSHQKIDDRPLFKSIWFADYLDSLKENACLRIKYFLLETNRKQYKDNKHGKNCEKIFFFFKKISPVMYSCIVKYLQSGLNVLPPDDCLLRSLGNQRL